MWRDTADCPGAWISEPEAADSVAILFGKPGIAIRTDDDPLLTIVGYAYPNSKELPFRGDTAQVIHFGKP